MRAWIALVTTLLVTACSGGTKEKAGHTQDTVTMLPLPTPYTRATLSGPLCEDDHCTCRDLDKPDDAGAGYPNVPGTKRFEVHIGPAENPLWVMVDDMVLYKSEQHSEDCYYLDLRPGPHQVHLRASRDGGLSAAVEVHELGTTSKSWYDTFAFNCGSPGACSTDDLDAWKQSIAGHQRNLFDGCGSTKVKGIAWDAGQAPDQAHPKELQLDFTLEVFEFDPPKPHGDPDCRDKL